jgi:hypothetical protein
VGWSQGHEQLTCLVRAGAEAVRTVFGTGCCLQLAGETEVAYGVFGSGYLGFTATNVHVRDAGIVLLGHWYRVCEGGGKPREGVYDERGFPATEHRPLYYDMGDARSTLVQVAIEAFNKTLARTREQLSMLAVARRSTFSVSCGNCLVGCAWFWPPMSSHLPHSPRPERVTCKFLIC